MHKTLTNRSNGNSTTMITTPSHLGTLKLRIPFECDCLNNRHGILASVTGLAGPRSYRVKVGEKEFVRNRCQLISSDKHSVPVSDTEQALPDSNAESEISPLEPVQDSSQLNSPRESAAPTTVGTPMKITSPSPTGPAGPRRSSQVKRPLDWVTSYVPS